MELGPPPTSAGATPRWRRPGLAPSDGSRETPPRTTRWTRTSAGCAAASTRSSPVVGESGVTTVTHCHPAGRDGERQLQCRAGGQARPRAGVRAPHRRDEDDGVHAVVGCCTLCRSTSAWRRSCSWRWTLMSSRAGSTRSRRPSSGRRLSK
jgi:hypothetical protein